MNLSYTSNHQNGQIIDCHRSCHSPRLRDKAYTKSDIGFRDHFAFLTPKRAVPTAYRPFPGIINTIHRSGTATFPAGRKLSHPRICEEGSSSDDPFTSSLRLNEYGQIPSVPLLVPLVYVTSETRVVDTGYQNFWVAVEIMASLDQAASDSRTSSEAITSGIQKPSNFREKGKTSRRCQNREAY